MAESTGAEGSPSNNEGRTDLRYHPAFQRGYSARDSERPTGSVEQSRRPRETGSTGAPSGATSDSSAHRSSAADRPAAEVPGRFPSARLANAAPANPAAAPAAEPAAPNPAAPDPAADASPAAPPRASRRIAGALAGVGAAFTVLGLLALWRSSQSWYDYSPSQGVFGPEQYLRVLSDNAIGPCLTVGLVALGLAVIVPLLTAVRR
ncbi:hypothetical protein [Rathayibacter agropyri]|uniref:hypothetical protein n=1 Tax=Rathayibacter agropyri TaxID=1634927 RepID=UPI0015678777|nr:hypothetical protein [Rathayibacter agropyri]NRD08846.1 hypothetical protein [Rathayibacter agropyri]